MTIPFVLLRQPLYLIGRSQFAFVSLSTCCFNWLISFSFCAFNARNRSDSSFIWRMSLTRADFIPWKKKFLHRYVTVTSASQNEGWIQDMLGATTVGWVVGWQGESHQTKRCYCGWWNSSPSGRVLPWQVSKYVFHWYVWHVKCITDEKRTIILSGISTRIWSQTRKVKFPPKKDCTADV